MKKDIFNKMAKKGFYLLLYSLAPLFLVGCNEFLTIYPTDKTIGEDFWKSKEDVNNMVRGAYSQMISEGCQEKAIVWGSFRSDELVQYKDNGNSDLQNVSAVNLLPTNGYNSWGDFYAVINRCNIVLNHIDEVLEVDPAFTQGDYDETRAQMLALRSLCYFYLVRTFRDVPYTTQSYEDDDQEMAIPQSTPDSVLQFCIRDLEEAERYIMKSGAYGTGNWRNKGYFTTDAVRALLADIYLWRASMTHDAADYQKCVEYADKIIQAKHEYYMSVNTERINQVEEDIYHLTEGSLMFIYLFDIGNSHESILEWQYNSENAGIGKYYVNGHNDKHGIMMASKIFTLYENAANTKQGQMAFHSRNDYRFWQSVYDANNGEAIYGLDVRKMVETSYSIILNPGSGNNAAKEKPDKMPRTNRNWIVYRLTDVMLMKAEALVQLANDEGDDENLKRAFHLVQAVNKRSLYRLATDTLQQSSYRGKEQMEFLVLAERGRELCFEGKRWFDLMRYSYRHMDGVDIKTKMANKTEWPVLYDGMLKLVIRKYVDGGDAVSYKMKSEPFLYWPVLENELKVNKQLKQNPVFIQEETTIKR
jgi:hypothetical protein